MRMPAAVIGHGRLCAFIRVHYVLGGAFVPRAVLLTELPENWERNRQ
jgi:hypothetical protein